ncbi:MAG: hypothetical protein NZM38_04990 [Cytophagales bacterium]|nr:hypothetical protein [Cytophagales bacterium]MDW8384108.1 hypothetical protein [Flammeovirgaceae bacterium]
MYDISLNYAPQDNLAQNSSKGWINFFVDFLKMALYEMSGREFSIFFDEKTSFLPSSTILINVLSPHFVAEKECIERLKKFLQETPSKLYIFKVLKEPLSKKDYHPLLAELENLPNYPFYWENEKGQIEHFAPFFKFQGDDLFSLQLLDICYDILQIIEKKEVPQKAVYLAECGKDLFKEKALIRRELKQNGFRVLPEKPYPIDYGDAAQFVEQEMQKVHVSIHLIGNDYGTILRGDRISIPELEIQLSEKFLQQKDFYRFVWISLYANPTNQYQQNLLEKVKTFVLPDYRSEVYQTKIQYFKNTLIELLQKNENPIKLTSKQYQKAIYLQFDRKDIKWATTVEQLLELLNFKVLQLPYNIDVMQARNLHRKYLNMCTLTLILFDSTSEKWLTATLQDAFKAPGFRKDFELLPIGVVVRNATQKRIAEKIIHSFKNTYQCLLLSSEELESFVKQF